MIRLQKNEDRGKPASLALAVRVAHFALRFYKTYLSILFAGNCRFHPTCSQYAYEAIERFGLARGIWLGLKRLLRCQPLSSRFGYDPVPERSSAPGLTTNCGAGAAVASRAAETPHEVHS